MSDDTLDNAPQAVDPANQIEAATAPASAGQLLKQAREASGLHIASLSMALKVPVKKLEALEADDWAQLPDAVFVRALATSVCRHVKTDSAPILAVLPQSAQAKLIDEHASRGLNQTFRAANDPKPSLLRLPVSMPMVLGALVLLLAAMVIIFLPDMAKQQDIKKPEIVESMPTPPVLVPAEVVPASAALPALPPAANASASAPTASPAPVLAPAAVASAPVPAVAVVKPIVATPTVVAPAVVAPAVVAASAPVPPANQVGTPALRMVAKGVVWVEVKDGKGALLVQRTLQPKEVVNVNGASPLAVVVGRINEMQSIDVRGKPFSLAGLSPDNVARFQVK